MTCSGGVCDTTILFVNVAPPVNCDDIFTQNEITIPSAIAQGFLCIPIPPGEISGYNVTVDGNAFTAFTPCDYGDVLIYNYNSVPLGSFTLDSWTVNGETFMGTFPSIQTLVDSMNVWDPVGGWENNINGSTISGGASGSAYGNLVITGNLGGIFNISPDLVLLPLGSNLEITGFGSHQVIVSQANGCADTATVILEQYVVTTETLFFETNLNTSVTPICATTDELIGNFQTFNLCGLPANGSISIIGDTCVSYTPNLNFTGTDGFCLVVCDDYQPIVCDTFYVVIQTQLPVDTVFVDADDVVPFEECLDGSVLQLPGNIDTAFICASNPAEVELGFVGNCVTIDLADDFVGVTMACVVHCTSDVPPICDTTYLVIEFDGTFPCDDIFIPDQVNVMLSNDTGEVCLPIPVMDINDYTVFLDGAVYTGQLTGCDVDSIYTYFYSQVFGQGNAGPYNIKWLLNGVNQTATVADMVALVNLMNGLDPAGMWVLDQNLLTISSSNDSGDYGLLEIAHPSGTVAGLTPNFIGVPNGTLVVFTGSGQHEVVLVENFTNCDDTLFINAVAALDTIQITTFENTPSSQTCIDTTGLPGNFVEMTVCGNPANGTIVIDEECFIYIPNGGFTGNDEACLQICDDQGNCEIWIVEISVVPLCSQYNFFPDGVISVAAPDCAALAAYCFPIEIDSLINFGVLDNGVPYTNFTTCNGNFSQISLDTGFHEIIVVHLLTQCSDTLLVNVTCQPDNGCGIMALNDLDLLASDCDSLTEFCVNVAVNDLANFVVSDNGQPATEVGPCSTNPQFVGVALDTGFHELVFADTVKGCVDTFLVNINCFTVQDSTIDIQVVVGDSLEICLVDYDFPVNVIDSLVNICNSQSDGEASFVIDPTTWCITIYGETIGQDTFCFKAYFGDTCAVLTVNVDVINDCPDYFPNDQLLVTTSCSNDSALVCLPLDVAILETLEIEVNGQPLSTALVPCGFDSLLVFPYFELPNNGMIGPYVVNEWTINGVTVTGTFDSATELADSMSVWDPTGNWTVSTNANGNTIITGGNLNTVYGAMTVEQTLFGNIVTIDLLLEISSSNLGLLLPLGASTVTFTDTLTNCAETIIVDVNCVQMDTVELTVEIGAVDTFCLDLTELLGNVVSVENICEDLGGTDVSFEIIGECVVFTGIDPGADTACLVVCDDLGICDTTILIVTAETMGVDTILIAVDDNVTTGEGQVLNIDVLQNDIFITLTDFNIIDDPLHGQAAFSPNGDINYVPNVGYCDDEEPDFFTYEICNASGCDTATVFVLVQCSELEIFNAISPNEDGKNDFFRIKGLQNYPNHKLYIYNRWGNLVHEATNYQSDWDGTWDGKDLPDGTYFYMLDLGEGDKPMKGYLQINR
ncbi:MAG: gliding motility-associated C-terminal domain-containing protein [Saprospiraceae bacterium]